MANGEKMAEKAFNEFKKCLEKKLKFNYSTGMNNGKHVIQTGIQGVDLPMQLHFIFEHERECTVALSQIPTIFSKEKIIEGAVAIAMINHKILQGCFDLNIDDGTVVYRLVDDWSGGVSNGAVCEYMISIMYNTIEEYNDKLAAFSEGKMTRDELFDFIRNN